MTSEQKALELVNAVRKTEGLLTIRSVGDGCGTYGCCWDALCRAIETHEADKARHAAELREQAERFSEAVKAWRQEDIGDASPLVCEKLAAAFNRHLSPFILPSVDPLVEAVKSCGYATLDAIEPEFAADLRAALEARGLAIVKKETTNE